MYTVKVKMDHKQVVTFAAVMKVRAEARRAGYNLVHVDRCKAPYITTLLCPKFHKVLLPFALSLITDRPLCHLCEARIDPSEVVLAKVHPTASRRKPKVDFMKICDLTAQSQPRNQAQYCDWLCPAGHIESSCAKNLKRRALSTRDRLCRQCATETARVAR